MVINQLIAALAVAVIFINAVGTALLIVAEMLGRRRYHK